MASDVTAPAGSDVREDAGALVDDAGAAVEPPEPGTPQPTGAAGSVGSASPSAQADAGSQEGPPLCEDVQLNPLDWGACLTRASVRDSGDGTVSGIVTSVVTGDPDSCFVRSERLFTVGGNCEGRIGSPECEPPPSGQIVSVYLDDGAGGSELAFSVPTVPVVNVGDQLVVRYAQRWNDLPFYRHRSLHVSRDEQALLFMIHGPLEMGEFEQNVGLEASYGDAICGSPGDFCGRSVVDIVFRDDTASINLSLGESARIGNVEATFLSGELLIDTGACDGLAEHAFAFTFP
jgi:hypothetical protein